MTATIYRSLALADVEVSTGKYNVLEGRALPYDVWANVGMYLEAWAVHSLNSSTVNGTRALPLMLFHDRQRFPIGHSTSWRSSSDGLHGTWQLNDSEDAQTAARLADRGDLAGLSIGFQAGESRWSYASTFDPERGPEFMDRVLRVSGRLLEVSVVSTPAFADAAVTNVRHAARDARASRQRQHPTDQVLARYPTSMHAWQAWVRQHAQPPGIR